MQEWTADASAMTFDAVSMERSKGFVKALQELKNLRPQLYSAADYCEKSYLHNEQKQIVLENLKDYAVRALVNAVDHLGTVAYKLNDLFDQQASDLGTVGMKISSLNQRVLSSQCFIDEDNLRERQLFAVCPRLQKRYILPNAACKAPGNGSLSPIRSIPSPKPLDSASKAPANGNPSSLSESNQSTIQSRTYPNSQSSQSKAPANGNQSPIQSTPGPHPPRTPGTKTLLWHLAAESNGISNGASKPPWGNDDPKKSKNSDLPLQTAHKAGSSTPPPDLVKQDAAVANELSGVGKEIIRAPIRSKSMLSAFFVKNKYPKQKKALVL